jgi:hypothetical protein
MKVQIFSLSEEDLRSVLTAQPSLREVPAAGDHTVPVVLPGIELPGTGQCEVSMKAS